MLGPSLLFGEPSQAELFDKASRAELFSEKASWAELFAFKNESNWALPFPKLSNFWLFSVDFFSSRSKSSKSAFPVYSSQIFPVYSSQIFQFSPLFKNFPQKFIEATIFYILNF